MAADGTPTALPEVVRELIARFGEGLFTLQNTVDRVPTLWLPANRLQEVLRYLKKDVPKPYTMLYDLTAMDGCASIARACRPPTSR